MLKRITIVFATTTILAVGFLWLIGNRETVYSNANLGQTSNESRMIALVSEALAQKAAPLAEEVVSSQPVFQYQEGDLQKIDQENPDLLAEYGRALVNILSAYSQPTTNEAALTLKALENSDKKAIAKIGEAKERHLQTAQRLLDLAIPSSASKAHLALTNSLIGLAELDFYMQKALTEPIAALESAGLYGQRYAELIRSTNQINQYFAEKGIKFDPEDITPIIIRF